MFLKSQADCAFFEDKTVFLNTSSGRIARALVHARRRPGPPPAHPRERQGRQEVFRAHAEQHGGRASAHADRVPGEPPAGRRHRHDPRRAEAVLRLRQARPEQEVIGTADRTIFGGKADQKNRASPAQGSESRTPGLSLPRVDKNHVA